MQALSADLGKLCSRGPFYLDMIRLEGLGRMAAHLFTAKKPNGLFPLPPDQVLAGPPLNHPVTPAVICDEEDSHPAVSFLAMERKALF